GADDQDIRVRGLPAPLAAARPAILLVVMRGTSRRGGCILPASGHRSSLPVFRRQKYFQLVDFVPLRVRALTLRDGQERLETAAGRIRVGLVHSGIISLLLTVGNLPHPDLGKYLLAVLIDRGRGP